MWRLQDIVVPVTGVDNIIIVAAQHSRRGGERVRRVGAFLWFSGCQPACLIKEVKKLPLPAKDSALAFSFSYVQIISEQEESVSPPKPCIHTYSMAAPQNKYNKVWLALRHRRLVRGK